MVFLPGTALEGLLCAFDVERTSFAVSGSDGRVKVFDAASGLLQTDFGASGTGGKQLVENYTSICWGARPLVRRHAPSPAFSRLPVPPGRSASSQAATHAAGCTSRVPCTVCLVHGRSWMCSDTARCPLFASSPSQGSIERLPHLQSLLNPDSSVNASDVPSCPRDRVRETAALAI